MRNGITYWISPAQYQKLAEVLMSTTSRFIAISEIGRVINVADIVLIGSVQDYEEYQNVKRGKWLCKYGTWHGKQDGCACGQNGKLKIDIYNTIPLVVKKLPSKTDLGIQNEQMYTREKQKGF